jgi:hypothetical protein
LGSGSAFCVHRKSLNKKKKLVAIWVVQPLQSITCDKGASLDVIRMSLEPQTWGVPPKLWNIKSSGHQYQIATSCCCKGSPLACGMEGSLTLRISHRCSWAVIWNRSEWPEPTEFSSSDLASPSSKIFRLLHKRRAICTLRVDALQE